jgi:hypothetical protein
MSTIKSSTEHLTINADGTGKEIKFQCNGVEKASISSAGAFTSTTIDATKLTGAVPSASYTDTDTVYTHPTSAGNKHIPSGGSADQVLTYSASGTASWQNAGGGGGVMELIQTVNVTTSVVTVDFTGLDNTYSEYKIQYNWERTTRDMQYIAIKAFRNGVLKSGWGYEVMRGVRGTIYTTAYVMGTLHWSDGYNSFGEVSIFNVGISGKDIYTVGRGGDAGRASSPTTSLSNSVCYNAGATGETWDGIRLSTSFSNIPAGAVIRLYGVKA